jgi:aryl-alcohol dehydrogenase-like predicted oxidoreductase
MSGQTGNMPKRHLGVDGPLVSAMGLGTMSMGHVYGRADDAESLATLELAFASGVTFFDTADFYGVGHSQEVLRSFVKEHDREEFFISSKYGPMLLPGGVFGRMNGDPEHMKHTLAYDLKRLGVDYIDLYFPARVDRSVPIETQVEALAEMVDQGFIRHIGLSEASPETVRKAHEVHPISAVQVEYSLWSREPERELLSTLQELGIALVAYAPLSRGFLSGVVTAPGDFESIDIRHRMPRFNEENFQANLEIVKELGNLASAKGVSTAQLAIAWILAQGENIIALVGTKTRAHLEEDLGATMVELTREDLDSIDEIMQRNAVAGDRYGPAQMTSLNQ